jgi:DNA polymerase III epsilon subunit-like protein
MKILALDTETTSLTPQSGQVIEIAGVILEFDEINLTLTVLKKFEQTVALRGFMDDRITRITGITTEELSIAKPIHKVQDGWYEFIFELPKDTPLIGHSLQFDIDFLESEGWYLPQDYRKIDTLTLAKILYPEASAINLEHLTETYQLSPRNTQLSHLNLTDSSQLKAHRALYDSLCAANLFEHEAKKLSSLPLDQEVYRAILQLCLPLEITFFSHKLDELDQDKSQSQTSSPEIRFDGTIVQANLYENVNKMYSNNQLHHTQSYLSLNLPFDLQIILLQLIIIMTIKRQNPNISLKMHGRNSKDFLFCEMVLDSLPTNDSEAESIDNLVVLKQFENIITHIKYIAEDSYNITKYINLLELFVELKNPNADSQNDFAPLQKIISSYDFLLLTLQSFWQRSEYQYNSLRLKPEEQVVKNKLEEFFYSITSFDPHSYFSDNPLQTELLSQISIIHNELSNPKGLIGQTQILFRFQGNTLTGSTIKWDFDLSSHLEKVFNAHSNIAIETYFGKDDFESFLQLIGVDEVFKKNNPKIEYKNVPFQSLYTSEFHGSLEHFIEEKNTLSHEKNSFVLLLCGQNSSIRDIEKSFTKNLRPEEYIILGESGSLTKVASKMMKLKKGLVCVKLGDFYYLSRYRDSFEFSEVWIINTPYFQINRYWFSAAKKTQDPDGFMNMLKWMYLRSQSQYISEKSGLQVQFLKGYH